MGRVSSFVLALLVCLWSVPAFAQRTTGEISGRVVDATLEELAPGEVVLRAAYSSVNYKDALAATGTGGRIVRKYPLVGGIDVAGVVASSGDARFKPGDEVICTSYDLGVAHDGGYAQMCRVPADWVVPLPQGLTSFEAMALGTAITVAVLATLALGSRELALKLGGASSKWASVVWTTCSLGGALVICLFGALLVGASLGPARPF